MNPYQQTELTERLINLLIKKEHDLELKTAQAEFLIRRNYDLLETLAKMESIRKQEAI